MHKYVVRPMECQAYGVPGEPGLRGRVWRKQRVVFPRTKVFPRTCPRCLGSVEAGGLQPKGVDRNCVQFATVAYTVYIYIHTVHAHVSLWFSVQMVM